MFQTVNITWQIHSGWLIRGITSTVTWHALIITLIQFQIILTKVYFPHNWYWFTELHCSCKKLIGIIFTLSKLNKGVIVIQHPPTFTNDQKMFVHCDTYCSTHNCMERERKRERDHFINTCTLICLHTECLN